LDRAYLGLAHTTGALPVAHPRLHGVERVRNLSYRVTRRQGNRAHLLDLYRPKHARGRLPVVLYIHGGAFRALSKDSHWLFGLGFARRGYLVFSINYRLAPEHRYPAAFEDAAAAYAWVVREAAAWGGDPSRIIVAGESAGGNLATALAVATAYRRPEPAASALFDAGVQPRAAIPICPLLQVSNPERFWQRKRLPFYVRDLIATTALDYLPHDPREPGALADPLLILEQERPARPLPPFFAAVGTRDPLLDDTRRLEKALAAHGTACTVRYYPGEVHAFHAFIWRSNARACWREMLAFLKGLG
jgi:acetyl esterase